MTESRAQGGSDGARRRTTIIVALASLVAWSLVYLALEPRHPYGDLAGGSYTDHFSHMNAARLFLRVGPDLWSKPVETIVSSHADGSLYVPGWPDKPLLMSWPQIPRPYPPGDLLLASPVAFAYHFTGLSFYAANRLLILLFLLYGHVSLFVLWDGIFAEERRAAAWLIALVAYSETIHWCMEGFYDAAVIAPLLLSARALARGKGLGCVVAFAAAAVLHFRAYLFVPWATAGAVLVLRQRQWREWRRTEWILAALAAGCLAASLYAFALVAPWLDDLPNTNVLSIEGDGTWVVLVAVGIAVAAAFAHGRSWIDLALLGWILLALVGLRQVQQWHVVLILPWLGAPIAGGFAGAARTPVMTPSRVGLVEQARLAFFLVVSAAVFAEVPFPLWLRVLG